MEQHSESEPEPQARADRRQAGNSGQSQGDAAQSKGSSQPKNAKNSGAADPSQAINNSAAVDVPEPQASPVPRPSGPIDLSANLPADITADTPDLSGSAETFSSSGSDTQGDPGTLSVGAPPTQRSATPSSGAGVPSGFKRTGASATGNTASLSNALSLNLPAAQIFGDAEESAGAPAQATQQSSQASPEQSVSPQGGNSPGHGPASAEMGAEVPTNAAPSSDPVAFEAKLTPSQSSSAATGDAAQGTSAQSLSQPGDQTGLKGSPAAAAADTSAPAPSTAARAETLFTIGATPASPAATVQTSPGDAPGAVAVNATPAAERMQPLLEGPAPLTGSPHSITVRVPGADLSTGIDLRFVERGGDIHLSVRTPSADLAQELRGGLNDLTGRLAHAGIRAEITSPAPSQSSSADSSPGQSKNQSEPDRRGFGGNSGDSQNQQQEPRGSNRSRWMAALADTQFSKEQNL